MDEIAAVPETETGEFMDSDGNVLRTQREKDVTYVHVKIVPAMGYRTIRFCPDVEEDGGREQISRRVPGGRKLYRNPPFYSVEINDRGQMKTLYDKENQRNVLAPGERGECASDV